MIELDDPRLFLVYGAPLAAAVVVFAIARAQWLWTRIALALTGHVLALLVAVTAAGRILQRGGFSSIDIDGWVGARVSGVDPFALVPSVLTGGTAPLLVAMELAGLVAAILLIPAARRARSSAPLAGTLVCTAFCAMLVVARRVDGICAAFALAALSGEALLVSFHPRRADVEGSVRAFLLHRAGDALLLVGVFVVGAALGGLDLEKLPQQAPAIEPWARAVSGPLAGWAAREVWILMAALVAAAAASRLALVVLPLVRDAVGAPGAAVGLAHGACFLGAGLVLLVRMTPVLWLAPEVLTVLAWVAPLSAGLAALFALAGRDLVRIDVQLLCAFAALTCAAFAVADLGTGVLATALLVAAAVPLCATTGVVVDATARTDPHGLGGLEKILPRTHTARLLTTGALFGPIFTGAACADHTVASALFSPWADRGPALLVVLALPLVSLAAFRPLHLVFTGKTPREPLSSPASEPALWLTLPPLVVALPLIGLGLAHLPEGVLVVVSKLRALSAGAVETSYRSPAGFLVQPERGVLHALRLVVLAPERAPSISPLTVVVVVVTGLLLGWAASTALYRGGPSALHRALFGGKRVEGAVAALAQIAGRESTVAKGVGEGAERLSRLIATNLAPGVLDTLLRRIPTLVAGLAGFLVRFIANGSAQRGLVVALVVLAVLIVVLR